MFEQSRQGAVDVIQPGGPLKPDSIGELAELLEACLERGQLRVVLDMQKTPLMDSAALELLLDWQENFEARGGALKLAGPSPLCREILSITGVGNHFEVHEDVGPAVGSFV